MGLLESFILALPPSEIYNTYAVVSPAPGNPGSGGAVAYRHRKPLGTSGILGDGRKFRFGAAGGSTLVVGDALTSGVATASQQNLTPAAAAVGARQVSLTTGASSALNLFAEGFLVVSVTPGGGDTYKIAGHLLMTTGAGDLVNLADGNAVRTALTTSSRCDLIPNHYFAAIQSPASTVASNPLGAAVSPPTTLRGCWIQTGGIVGMLTSGSAIAGDVVGTGLGTGGAVGPIAALATQPIFGVCVFAAASGAWSTIRLTID